MKSKTYSAIQLLLANNNLTEAINKLKKISKNKRKFDSVIEDDITAIESSINNFQQEKTHRRFSSFAEEDSANSDLVKRIQELSKIIENKNKFPFLLQIIIEKPIQISIIILLVIFSALFVREYLENRKSDLILMGSGTVYNFLEKNCKLALKNDEYEVVRLDAPSGTAITTYVYSFTRPAIENKPPSIIGMASEELHDSLFTIQEPVYTDRKFYAVNLFSDTLLISLGCRQNDQTVDGITGAHNTSLNPDQIKKLLNIVEHVYVTVPNSGTYKEWNKLFKMNNINWPDSQIRYIEESDRSQSQVAHDTGRWIALSSRSYNIGKSGKCIADYNVEIDGKIKTRPLYLFGLLIGHPKKYSEYNDKYIYKITDKDIYEFWKIIFAELSHDERFTHRINDIKQNFIVPLKDGGLGVVDQPEHEKIILY